MAYLLISEYVARAGEAEAVRTTDEAKSGSPDNTKIDRAIIDATTMADAYLGNRYALPIASPPELLKGIIYDLARERLHGQRPTDTVTRNADKARALLKDLSAGRASIPAPANGTSPTEVATGGARRAGDARPRVFSDQALADFTDLSGGYGGTVFDGPCGW